MHSVQKKTTKSFVVDDGGSDDTFGETLRTAERLGCRARAIRHAASAGQSTAVMTGARHAQGTLIVTMDGDGQNDPADVPRLLAQARAMTSSSYCIAGYRKQRKDTP